MQRKYITLVDNVMLFAVMEYYLTLFRMDYVYGIYADSADPFQTSQDAASHQCPHCLHTGIFKQNTVKMKTST